MARKPIFSKASKQGQFKTQGPGNAVPPQNWVGSSAEWHVWRELTSTHGLVPNSDFTYQARLTLTGGLPGRLELGGLVADFLLSTRGLILNPLSEYFHYSDLQSMDRERDNGEALERMGWQVVYIDSDDLDRDAIGYVTEALRGVDHSKLGRGVV